MDIYDGENLTGQAQDYYNAVSADIEELILNYDEDLEKLKP